MNRGYVAPPVLPLWLKIAYTLFVCFVIPVYWGHYGWRNFLWFSDIALMGTVVALWLESGLVAGMMFMAIALPELAWNFSFWGRLISGKDVVGLTGYMFDARRPLWIRAISLFHVFLPVVLAWMVWRLGYDRRALVAQTLLAWVVLPVTWLVTEPQVNINWVYGPGSRPQKKLKPLVYLLIVMGAFPLVFYMPVDLALRLVMRR
jgi:hypothetical protein